MAIHFFTEDLQFKLKRKQVLKAWLNHVISNEGKRAGELNYIFTSDKNILRINRQYLNHDYFTDIITFNYNQDLVMNGDIFISAETVAVNASSYSVSFDIELRRVMVHGILHLIGYDDATSELKTEMKGKEDFYLDEFDGKFLLK